MTDNANLYSALRAAFPEDLDSVAIEVADSEGLAYTWRDLERGTARLANWLAALQLASRASHGGRVPSASCSSALSQ